MEDNTLYILIWTCIAACVITFILNLFYYLHQKPSDNEVLLELLNKHDVHPIVLECMQRDWSSTYNFEMCRQVLSDSLTAEDIEKIQSIIKGDM